MEERTTLVTGGAGFIGSHLCEALLKAGERVICVDNYDSYYDPAQKRHNVANFDAQPGFVFVEADIRHADFVYSIFADYKPQRVAHLAALAGVRASIERAADYNAVNVAGTINLLEAARKTEVENFVFASTSSIYGRTDQTPFVESQPTDQPLAPYPATKKAGEVMGHAFHNMFGLKFTALRFFTVYGPRVRPDLMAYKVMDDILNDREIMLFNAGDMHRDWTYVGDVISGVVAALDRPVEYDILNLGRGEPVRLGDFITHIEKLLGKTAKIKVVDAPASEPQITFANVDKARELLGYNPTVSIEEGLAHTWNWYQNFNNL